MPIRNKSQNLNTPMLLVDFPTKEVFLDLYRTSVPKATVLRYWDILNARKNGASMRESGALHSISKQRVEQIEAKFVRLLGERYWKQTEDLLSLLSAFSSVLEMHEKDQP